MQRRWPTVAVPVLHGFALMLPILLGDLLHPHDLTFGSSIWVTAFAVELVLYAVGTVFVIFMLVSERTVTAHKTAASMDPLTGMFNRRGFAEATSRVIEREAIAGRPVTALIFDIDHFKSINDRFGHPAGDEILKLFATVVVNSLRISDLSGRIGGEEFAALLPCSLEEGVLAAERVREAFADSGIVVEEGPVDTTGQHRRPADRRAPSSRCCWRRPIPRSTRPSAAGATASRPPKSCRCRWKSGGARPRALPVSSGRACRALHSSPFDALCWREPRPTHETAGATLRGDNPLFTILFHPQRHGQQPQRKPRHRLEVVRGRRGRRGGFACLFSSAEEYETALISERRAQGRYDQPRSLWPVLMFIGCSLVLAGSVLLLS